MYKHFLTLSISLSVLIATHSSCEVTTGTLCVNQVTDEGFGNVTNRYAWAMQTFKGSVFVATLNAVNAPAFEFRFFTDKEFESNGAQIYIGTVNNTKNSTVWNWRQIVSGGLGDVSNFGVRKFAVAGDYVYAVTANYKYGFEIWRTNATHFERIMVGGFGNVNNTSGRGMGVFGDYLYIGTENRETGAQMYRRQIHENGEFVVNSEWEVIADDGFGDKNNMWFSDMIEFNGYLYVGTLNRNGMQLWRSKNGKTLENVFRNGNGSRYDTAVMKLYEYKGRLYIGTMNFLKGASLWVSDDSKGLSFVPVFVEGNGNRWNSYVWNLRAFNGRLYVGMLVLSDGGYGIPGFELLSSKEAMPHSNDWINETMNGFGNPGQSGVRSITVTDDGQRMMIGSATDISDLGCIVFEATARNVA